MQESRTIGQLSQSLIIPAFNESNRIEQTLAAVTSYLSKQPYTFEIIVVDDGSTDDTAERTRRFAKRAPEVRVISIPHAGKAIAVRTGMRAATGDLIAFTDADLATPIAYLEPFRDAVDQGADLVIGSREGAGSTRIGEPRFRHVMGRVFNSLVRLLLLPGISDTQCGFKLFTNEAAAEILKRSRLYTPEDEVPPGPRVTAFDVEMLVIARKLGYAITVVPVTWTFGEQSKVDPLADTITNLRDVLTVKWNDLRNRYRP